MSLVAVQSRVHPLTSGRPRVDADFAQVMGYSGGTAKAGIAMGTPAGESQAASAAEETAIIALYHQLLESWNRRDATAYAALFEPDAHVIGFDGTPMNGRTEIEAVLRQIFADHVTATYVGKVRGVRFLTREVAILRGVVGMVPPGQSDINPAVNAMQTLVPTTHGADWRIALFQNTPAQFHGRPDAAETLTRELRELL